MANEPKTHKIFEEMRTLDPRRQLTLPWDRTLQMCWSNIQRRAGRFLLIFIGIAVVVAFLMSNLAFQTSVKAIKANADAHAHGGPAATAAVAPAAQAEPAAVKEDSKAEPKEDPWLHAQAVLERAGIFSDAASQKKQRDQQLWLMILASILCLVGITNTMLMSVTERIREIGTLKCLGALDGFVIRLFMIESIFIGLVGSLIGALAGYLLMLLQLGMVLEFKLILMANPILTFFKGVPLAVVAGTVMTVLAAVYPTYVAARMKPVDAMRVEI